MARRQRSRRQRSAHTEAASMVQARQVMAQALKAFRALRDPALQMRLAREAAFTRAAELTLAYTNVVMLSAGYKLKTLRNGQERLQRLPCVVFVVRSKWPQGQKQAGHQQFLPCGLLTYAEQEGVRQLVAVPTDVQLETRFLGARSQSARALYVDTVDELFGTLTCAVEFSGPGQPLPQRYALSALHVFTPAPALDAARPVEGAEVSAMTPSVPPALPPVLARSLPLGGRLRSQGRISFDVQLAKVPSWPKLAPLLADMPLSAHKACLLSIDEFDAMPPGQRFEFLVPDNHPDANFKARPVMLARFLNFMPPAFAIDYEVKVGNALREEPVHHWQLLKLELLLGRETLPGDSGSPVVAWNSDGSCTLVGMHIAGAGSWAYAIPSRRLFDLENFWRAPPGSRMRPVNP